MSATDQPILDAISRRLSNLEGSTTRIDAGGTQLQTRLENFNIEKNFTEMNNRLTNLETPNFAQQILDMNNKIAEVDKKIRDDMKVSGEAFNNADATLRTETMESLKLAETNFQKIIDQLMNDNSEVAKANKAAHEQCNTLHQT